MKPRKFVYWICVHEDDPPCTIRTRTRREALQERENYRNDDGAYRVDKPEKRVVEYFDIFDLIQKLIW